MGRFPGYIVTDDDAECVVGVVGDLSCNVGYDRSESCKVAWMIRESCKGVHRDRHIDVPTRCGSVSVGAVEIIE